MEHHQSERTLSEQAGIGHNRPTPSFVPASVSKAKATLQEDAGAQDMAQLGAPDYSSETDTGATNHEQPGVQLVTDASNIVHPEVRLDETAASLPHTEPEDYTIPVDEILIRLHEVGIEKSKDSVQRYCREGALDCQKLGLFKRYFATEKSLDTLIEKMQPDEDARNCIQVHEASPTRDVVETKHTDAPASNSAHLHQDEDAPKIDQVSQSKSSNNENLVDFLKDEIRVKNKQLEVKDTQIAAMLERDHETNILIRGLQNQLGETFAMLSGRSNREGSKDEVVRDL